MNIASDGADVTCDGRRDGRLFQKLAPEIGNGKARFPTVLRLNGGTASCLEEADRDLLVFCSQIRGRHGAKDRNCATVKWLPVGMTT